jgi:twinkle protein
VGCTKGPCPCGTSSDAFATYDDGGTWCYRCDNKKAPKDFKGLSSSRPKDDDRGEWTPIHGWTEALVKRGISEETCRKFSYQIGRDKYGNLVHIQNVKGEHGQLRGQKLRTKDKDFPTLGDCGGIIGSWLWPSKGKAVTITEGEIDMMSVSQAFDNKWPVGSLPNGTGSVEKALLRDYERICAFDSIVLCFDNDEPGQKAMQKACELLPVGKVKIMTLPKKDANEVLLDKELGPAALVRAFYDAKTWRPDGIREGREFTRDRMKTKQRTGYSLPFPKLNAMWMGLRDGEITTICAGSGIGKSTIARALAYHMRMGHGLKVGNIFLEEDTHTTVKAYVGLHAGIPLKQLIANPESVSDDQWDASLAAVVHDGMMFYDHFGSIESSRLLTMMRYMAASGCRFVVLDHISIVVSGLETHDERKDIDVLMTSLASFVKETGVGVIAVVHLKRGENYNEGAQISITDMRGSASIEQLSFNLLAIERDQQDEGVKLFATMRSLKCRVTGETGEADTLRWNIEKGRYEVASPFEAGEIQRRRLRKGGHRGMPLGVAAARRAREGTKPFDPHATSDNEEAAF